jgi:NADH-ubiquinone oxidoreductase chain 6
MFLIYLGGLIVLFIYISRLAYNEKFKILNNEVVSQLIIVTIIVTPTIFLFIENNLIKENKLEINDFVFKIYSASSTILTSLTIIYLIITLIVVVKITTQFYGPLRAKN